MGKKLTPELCPQWKAYKVGLRPPQDKTTAKRAAAILPKISTAGPRPTTEHASALHSPNRSLHGARPIAQQHSFHAKMRTAAKYWNRFDTLFRIRYYVPVNFIAREKQV